MLRALSDESPPLKLVTPKKQQQQPIYIDEEEVDRVELVFFVDEEETFQLDDLFGAEADLQNHTHCSSLYKVTLKNQVVYVVKKLRQVSLDEFGGAMRQIGNTKHPNILPLVAYSSTHHEKLMIYHYQTNGSLLNLLDDYIEGKKEFQWRWRLVIAGGIARGLDMIHQKGNVHGNLKPSNILLDHNMEAVISEYGFARFYMDDDDDDDTQKCCLINNGYTAPERSISLHCESSSDVYSFGVILLELLTGKTIEKTGMDLGHCHWDSWAFEGSWCTRWKLLVFRGWKAVSIHGDKTQSACTEALSLFKTCIYYHYLKLVFHRSKSRKSSKERMQ